jgi:RNA polymerase sigma-70 factor (ECF subfamily)
MNRKQPLDDRRLVARLRRGDETAIDELVARFWPLIFDAAVRRLSNREDAEEVAQDVLFTTWRKIGQFRQESALSSWIYRVTFNTVTSRLRARLRADPLARALPLEVSHAGEEDRSDGVAEPADTLPLADALLDRRRTRLMLVEALASLPPALRRAIVLHHVYGLSLRELGTRLADDPAVLRKRLFRGRQMLRERLAAHTSMLASSL